MLTEDDFIKIKECISIINTLKTNGIKGEVKRSLVLDSGNRATISQVPVYGKSQKTIRIDITLYS